ncbi:hypothetical protein QN239_07905 [Mycolicibacterium sp. Y3]
MFTLRFGPSALQRLLALVRSVKLDPERWLPESLLDPRAEDPSRLLLLLLLFDFFLLSLFFFFLLSPGLE